jgi:VanZ family protein
MAAVSETHDPHTSSPSAGRGLFRFLAVAATAGVVGLMLLPARDVPGLGVPGLDKVAHVGTFLALGVLWRLAGLRWGAVLALALLLAVTTEILQAALPLGRTADALDGLADMVGVFCAPGLVRTVPWRRRTPTAPPTAGAAGPDAREDLPTDLRRSG